MKKVFFVISLLVIGIYLFSKKENKPETRSPLAPVVPKSVFKQVPISSDLQPRNEMKMATLNSPKIIPTLRKEVPQRLSKGPHPLVMPYVLDEGIAVIQGDIAIGRPTTEEAAENGFAEVPHMNLWPTNVIPYHIQADLSNPERVKQALAMFEETNLRFVPFTDQKDVLVFEESSGICKSYVGKVGGKQQVWISSECSAREVAHEIMHAIGFVHEQNRNDRDDSVAVNFENIDERYKENFEKLPEDFMKISGQSSFDFESLMIYPVWMFAKNGQSTMQSKMKDRLILPSNAPSKLDIDRINRVYHN